MRNKNHTYKTLSIFLICSAFAQTMDDNTIFAQTMNYNATSDIQERNIKIEHNTPTYAEIHTSAEVLQFSIKPGDFCCVKDISNSNSSTALDEAEKFFTLTFEKIKKELSTYSVMPIAKSSLHLSLNYSIFPFLHSEDKNLTLDMIENPDKIEDLEQLLIKKHELIEKQYRPLRAFIMDMWATLQTNPHEICEKKQEKVLGFINKIVEYYDDFNFLLLDLQDIFFYHTVYISKNAKTDLANDKLIWYKKNRLQMADNTYSHIVYSLIKYHKKGKNFLNLNGVKIELLEKLKKMGRFFTSSANVIFEDQKDRVTTQLLKFVRIHTNLHMSFCRVERACQKKIDTEIKEIDKELTEIDKELKKKKKELTKQTKLLENLEENLESERETIQEEITKIEKEEKKLNTKKEILQKVLFFTVDHIVDEEDQKGLEEALEEITDLEEKNKFLELLKGLLINQNKKNQYESRQPWLLGDIKKKYKVERNAFSNIDIEEKKILVEIGGTINGRKEKFKNDFEKDFFKKRVMILSQILNDWSEKSIEEDINETLSAFLVFLGFKKNKKINDITQEKLEDAVNNFIKLNPKSRGCHDIEILLNLFSSKNNINMNSTLDFYKKADKKPWDEKTLKEKLEPLKKLARGLKTVTEETEATITEIIEETIKENKKNIESILKNKLTEEMSSNIKKTKNSMTQDKIFDSILTMATYYYDVFIKELSEIDSRYTAAYELLKIHTCCSSEIQKVLLPLFDLTSSDSALNEKEYEDIKNSYKKMKEAALRHSKDKNLFTLISLEKQKKDKEYSLVSKFYDHFKKTQIIIEDENAKCSLDKLLEIHVGLQEKLLVKTLKIIGKPVEGSTELKLGSFNSRLNNLMIIIGEWAKKSESFKQVMEAQEINTNDKITIIEKIKTHTENLISQNKSLEKESDEIEDYLGFLNTEWNNIPNKDNKDNFDALALYKKLRFNISNIEVPDNKVYLNKIEFYAN